MDTSSRFGFEWDHYQQLDSAYEAQFRNWVSPLRPESFIGKKVVDAGCGMGRNSYWPLLWGAATVTGFDYDQRTVAAARQTLSKFSNATVEFRSIYEINWDKEFDVGMSIGVIHHLEHPAEALRRLWRAIKPGGTLVCWVYSYEGNEWIVRYVNPVRKVITSRLPLPLLHVVSYCCSIPLWLFIKITGGTTPYLQQLKTFKLWHLHSIVFDQLLPPIANYWKREEVVALCAEAGIVGDSQKFSVEAPPNKMGWTLVAVKK